jgi:hypothetical protein
MQSFLCLKKKKKKHPTTTTTPHTPPPPPLSAKLSAQRSNITFLVKLEKNFNMYEMFLVFEAGAIIRACMGYAISKW